MSVADEGYSDLLIMSVADEGYSNLLTMSDNLHQLHS
jgi:hypothetical protein